MDSRDFVVIGGGVVGLSVARDFGFSERTRILPFKGLYLYSDEPAGAFRAHV
ncbi:MAG: L-2-hydroxyglutarate oxidase, partial [Elusimicrobia bacterium]|nr:L-2-hydroxyglutarate oxidase [Elusimicrobiota bacterium]